MTQTHFRRENYLDILQELGIAWSSGDHRAWYEVMCVLDQWEKWMNMENILLKEATT